MTTITGVVPSDELDMDVEIVTITAAVLTWRHNPAAFVQLPLPFILEVETLQGKTPDTSFPDNPNMTTGEYIKALNDVSSDVRFAHFRKIIEDIEEELEIRTEMKGSA